MIHPLTNTQIILGCVRKFDTSMVTIEVLIDASEFCSELFGVIHQLRQATTIRTLAHDVQHFASQGK